MAIQADKDAALVELLLEQPKVTYASRYGHELKSHPGSAGYDLVTPVDIVLPPGYEMCVHTGIRLKIESERPWFTMIVPRSSAGVKHDLVIKNTVGIIDPAYCGDDDELLVHLRRRNRGSGTILGELDIEKYEVHRYDGTIEKFDNLVHCTMQRDGVYLVTRYEKYGPDVLYKAGDQFAQLLFLPYGTPELHMVDLLGSENRGGFGSTG